MKILFLTLMKITSLSDEGIYMDLMREFIRQGHEVVAVSPLEKKFQKKTEVLSERGLSLIRCQTGDLFGVGKIRKALSQSLIPYQYERAVRDFCKGQASNREMKFDLILYSTPPISLVKVVKKLKRKTGAMAYLMLKDIFPQNAVDIGLLPSLMAKLLFRRTERELYQISDFIGCMSPANVDYLLSHNQIETRKVGLCANSISVEQIREGRTDRKVFSEKYGFDEKKLLFLYGGNLGLPQDLPFIIRCIEEIREEKDVHFIICGDGTEYGKLLSYFEEKKPSNLSLIRSLPKKDYEDLVRISDVGMIFLDYRFTIPNFPSRLLSYLKEALPVLVCTDEATDMGRIAEENGFGLYARSNSVKEFREKLLLLKEASLRRKLGENGRRFLEENYSVKSCYEGIMRDIANLREWCKS